MQDTVGNPIINVNSKQAIRQEFISSMRNFAQTIEQAENPDLLFSFLSPYLSMVGLLPVLQRLDSSVLVSGLKEAAEAAETNPDAHGVVFGFSVDDVLNVVAINLEDGSMSKKEVSIKKDTTNVASQIFSELSIDKELSDAAEEFNMVVLKKVSKALI